MRDMTASWQTTSRKEGASDEVECSLSSEQNHGHVLTPSFLGGLAEMKCILCRSQTHELLESQGLDGYLRPQKIDFLLTQMPQNPYNHCVNAQAHRGLKIDSDVLRPPISWLGTIWVPTLWGSGMGRKSRAKCSFQRPKLHLVSTVSGMSQVRSLKLLDHLHSNTINNEDIWQPAYD